MRSNTFSVASIAHMVRVGDARTQRRLCPVEPRDQFTPSLKRPSRRLAIVRRLFGKQRVDPARNGGECGMRCICRRPARGRNPVLGNADA